jgi:hypothetical protein
MAVATEDMLQQDSSRECVDVTWTIRGTAAHLQNGASCFGRGVALIDELHR